MKFLLASMTSFTNSDKSLFRLSDGRLCLSKLFRNPPVILKIVPKAGYECTMREKESQNINLMRLQNNF
jgi:hypothetical protein